MKNTPWLVIGAGAVGLFWACKLEQLGHKVHLVYRSTKPGKLISLSSAISGEAHLPSEHKVKSFKASELTRSYNKVLLCTKSFDLKDAFLNCKNNISLEADIACLCNGMGAQQLLQKELAPTQRLWVGTTSEGMLKTAKNQVTHTGLGDTFFGLWSTHSSSESFPLDNYQVPNIHPKLFDKLAINACINPLTAIFEIHNGELLNPEYSPLLEALITELESVFCHNKFEYKEHSQHLTKEVLTNRIQTVAQLTKLNRSSMYEDLRLERTTEIDYISGFLLTNSPIELPIQKLLYDAVTSADQRETYKKKLLNIV
ncbi:2-dehydropantoate 2-reductase [Marinomonas sp. C2222]|uniref:2-dehydropantoate 2-reductase n=1 Tax=Marinomonas sargassi TaxID=2984494 RepID=A0ABT2YSI6_9GAMM|nr:2-dehydropantoate 2-reductase [Marinomonas sargassi]MCV2402849.1 2-dehydropantoate 2-reductase [Marinomonas sargassi]